MKLDTKYALLSIVLLCVFSVEAYAQRPKKENRENNLDDNNSAQFLIENLVEENDSEEFDLDTQFEYLEGFAANPLDINNAKPEDLEQLGLLSAIQIQALMNYRKRFGQLYSPYELQGVPVFDMQTIRKILPYISFSASKEKDKLNFKRMFKYSKNQVFLRYQQILEKQDGFVDTTGTYYLGSPDKWYLRYNMSYKNKMSMGVTLEKDAGEQFLNPLSGQSNARFIDYFSAHFYLRDLSKNVKAVAIGDYRVYFGQGLTAWDGFRIRKGVDVLNIKRISV
ncbi:MAG: helix-hairpin-helix domain-containing protein, partial [Saprospiraceae bacterium]|nr:helix-hairpin-helix domain-containing protein [Saprospiraceae bacterium]